jgi:hypothetical protein
MSKNAEGETTLILNHLGVPVGDAGWMTESWNRNYWALLQEHFSKQLELA